MTKILMHGPHDLVSARSAIETEKASFFIFCVSFFSICLLRGRLVPGLPISTSLFILHLYFFLISEPQDTEVLLPSILKPQNWVYGTHSS